MVFLVFKIWPLYSRKKASIICDKSWVWLFWAVKKTSGVNVVTIGSIFGNRIGFFSGKSMLYFYKIKKQHFYFKNSHFLPTSGKNIFKIVTLAPSSLCRCRPQVWWSFGSKSAVVIRVQIILSFSWSRFNKSVSAVIIRQK
jgi:hypothetical protein